MTSVGLIVPTIDGREASLHRTLDSYAQNASQGDYELEVVRGYATVGAAWADTLPRMTTDLCHLTTDDVTADCRWLVPIRYEWERFEGLAVPLVLRQPGDTLESHGIWGVWHTVRTEVSWAGVPVVPQAAYEPIAEALTECGLPHYYSDNVIADVVRSMGFGMYAHPSLRLGHWWEAGGASPTRYESDGEAWQQWRRAKGFPPANAPIQEWRAWAGEERT